MAKSKKITDHDVTTTILKAARERIADPSAWQGPVPDGEEEDGGACACMAVWDSLGRVDSGLEVAVLDLLLGAAGLSRDPRATTERQACRWPIYRWNDTPGRTHAEVLAAFDRAIASGQGATA